MAQAKQNPNELVDSNKDDYFPKATVVYQAKPKEERKQSEVLLKGQTTSKLGSLKQIGVGDEAID